MSLEERGAHVTLLAWSWDNGPIPNDIKRIASILGVHKTIASRVIKHVFTRWIFEHDHWTNKRLEETRQKALNYSASRSYCGKHGGRPAQNGKPYGKHMGKHTESPPISVLRSPSPTPDQKQREREDLFDRFWKAYPRKVGKGNARKQFDRANVNEALLTRMLSALDWQSRSAQWTRDGGKFIPHPATWLHQLRWEDEPVAVVDSTEASWDEFEAKAGQR